LSGGDRLKSALRRLRGGSGAGGAGEPKPEPESAWAVMVEARLERIEKALDRANWFLLSTLVGLAVDLVLRLAAK